MGILGIGALTGDEEPEYTGEVMDTSHGHHIPDTPLEPRVHDLVSCGGIKVCDTCKEEVEDQRLIEASIEQVPVGATAPRKKDGPVKFRKKPVVIEAMKLQMDNAMTVYQWIEANTQGSFDVNSDEPVPASGVSIDAATGFMVIATLEGIMQVKLGDYVIRGVAGEFYPCKPEIFVATYSPEEG